MSWRNPFFLHQQFLSMNWDSCFTILFILCILFTAKGTCNEGKPVIKQHNADRKLKGLGWTIIYPCPNEKAEQKLSVLLYADASKGDTHGQPGTLAGLLVGDFENSAMYYTVSWISHKPKRSVKGVPAAEILASSEAIYEAKGVTQAYSEILNMDVRVLFMGRLQGFIHILIDAEEFGRQVHKG